MALEKFREKLKKLKMSNVTYPLITIMYGILVVALFIFTIRFLSENINKAFVLDQQEAEAQLVQIDMEEYYRVATKLGIPVIRPTPEPEPEEESETPGSATETPVPTATPSSAELDKKALSISVANTTKITGLAAQAKQMLEENGFVVSRTGNATPARTTTLIRTKASKKNYASLIRQVLEPRFELAADETLPASETFDVIILLGPPREQ